MRLKSWYICFVYWIWPLTISQFHWISSIIGFLLFFSQTCCLEQLYKPVPKQIIPLLLCCSLSCDLWPWALHLSVTLWALSSTFLAQLSLFSPKLLFWLEKLDSRFKIPLKITFSQNLSILPAPSSPYLYANILGSKERSFLLGIFPTSLMFANLAFSKWD